MSEEYQPVDLGGYEGDFKCPNCGTSVDINQGNSGGTDTVFVCPSYRDGCEKEWELFAKENHE